MAQILSGFVKPLNQFSVLVLSILICVGQFQVFAETIELKSPNEQELGLFGRSVTSVPDISGDGLVDVCVGAPGEGLAYLFDGSSGLLLGNLIPPGGPIPVGFYGTGMSVAGLPDVNGDGFGDVAMIGVDSVYVFNGRTQAHLKTLNPVDIFPYGFFLHDIVGLSDVNNNGSGDVAVGVIGGQWCDPTGIQIFDGATGSFLRHLSPPTHCSRLGWTIAEVPDVNGDGVNDLIAGEDDGLAYIFNPTNGQILRTLRGSFTGGYEYGFPSPVAGISDVNGDGRGDVVVGHPKWVELLSGTGGPYIRLLVPPNPPSDLVWGDPIAGISDMNGDGEDDVLVSAAFQKCATCPSYVFAFDGVTGSILDTLRSPNEDISEGNTGFGGSISGLPDIDGDNLAEVIIGNVGEDPGSSPNGAGRAYIFLSQEYVEPSAVENWDRYE